MQASNKLHEHLLEMFYQYGLHPKPFYQFITNSKENIYTWVVDQVWGQDGWILVKFFFCVFMDRDGVNVHKHAKKERGQY